MLGKATGVAHDAYRQYGEHFHDTLRPNSLGDFAAKNLLVQVKG